MAGFLQFGNRWSRINIEVQRLGIFRFAFSRHSMVCQCMPPVFLQVHRCTVLSFLVAVKRVINISCICIRLQGNGDRLVKPAGSIRLGRQRRRCHRSPLFFCCGEVIEASRLELVDAFKNCGNTCDIKFLSLSIREDILSNACPGIHAHMIACPVGVDCVEFKGAAWRSVDNVRHCHTVQLNQLALVGIIHHVRRNRLRQCRRARLRNLYCFGQLQLCVVQCGGRCYLDLIAHVEAALTLKDINPTGSILEIEGLSAEDTRLSRHGPLHRYQ
ncbi:hypothetical protein D3C75_518920 [compost metagenome]